MNICSNQLPQSRMRQRLASMSGKLIPFHLRNRCAFVRPSNNLRLRDWFLCSHSSASPGVPPCHMRESV
jgi:hypothetical protein